MDSTIIYDNNIESFEAHNFQTKQQLHQACWLDGSRFCQKLSSVISCKNGERLANEKVWWPAPAPSLPEAIPRGAKSGPKETSPSTVPLTSQHTAIEWATSSGVAHQPAFICGVALARGSLATCQLAWQIRFILVGKHDVMIHASGQGVTVNPA